MFIDNFKISNRIITSVFEEHESHTHLNRHHFIYSRNNIGSIVINNQEFTYKPDHIYYTPIGVSHDCKNLVGTNYDIIFFSVSDPDLVKKLKQLPYEIYPKNPLFIKFLIQQMHLQKNSNNPLANFYQFMYFTMLLVAIIDNTIYIPNFQDSETITKILNKSIDNTILNDSFNKLLEFINSYFLTDIDNNRLTIFSGYQRSHLYRLFKSKLNTTPHKYINTLRINHAKSLLENFNIKITDIALMVGFNSIDAFIHTFKQIEGCSPSEYRTQLNSIQT